MKSHAAATALVLSIASAWTTVAVAQRTAASKALGDDYYFYRSEAFGHHADDNAYMVGEYARYGERIPREIVEENARGIRTNIEASRRAYSKLSAATKNHPEAAPHLSAIEQHYQDALTKTKALEEESAKNGDPKAIAAHAADVQRSLRSANKEHRQLLKKMKTSSPPAEN